MTDTDIENHPDIPSEFPPGEEEYVASLTDLEKDQYRIHLMAGGKSWSEHQTNPDSPLYEGLPAPPRLRRRSEARRLPRPRRIPHQLAGAEGGRFAKTTTGSEPSCRNGSGASATRPKNWG